MTAPKTAVRGDGAEAEPDEKRKWPRRVAITVLVIVLVVVGLLVALRLRDRADPVDVDQVAADFDAAADTTDAEPADPGDVSADLAAGVFSYSATGSEKIDILGGPLHEFPPTVVQVVTPTECGYTVETALFEQRSDVLELCRGSDGGLELITLVSRHEFVGIKDETITTCPPVQVWWADPADLGGVGDEQVQCTMSGPLTNGEQGADVVRRVLGAETIRVGNEQVDTVRIAIDTTFPEDGAVSGTYDIEMWMSTDDPSVMVRRTLDSSLSSSTPLGRIGYDESYELASDSLDPL